MKLTANKRSWVALSGTLAIVALAGVACSTSSKSVAAKPNANATFLADVHAGASGSLLTSAPDVNIVALGQGVCGSLNTNDPGKVNTGMLGSGKGAAFPAGDAKMVIMAAGKDLCPAQE